MELSPLYLQRLEEATQRGIEQGIEQGIQQGIEQGIQQGIEQVIQQGIEQGIQQSKRETLESILQVRFGEIDEELAQIIEPLIQLEPLEMIRLIRQLDRPELLARFLPENQTES
jgi:flagellar biosynthesis/type III secretory pathway protein FliH